MQTTAIVLLLAAGLTASASGGAQEISLSVHQAPLGKIFKEIKKQSGYSFLYTAEMLAGTTPLDLDLKDVTLEQALQVIFAHLPLTYSILNRTVIVKARTEDPLPVQPPPPPGDVHGRVTDSAGAPLVGASVVVKGSNLGTETDQDGNFILTGIDSKATLIFSFTGYERKQIRLQGKTSVTVSLSHFTAPLDEIQVIAYGTQTQRFSVGNVTTVKSEDIEKQPVLDPLLALEGRVAGLEIVQQSGFAGTAVTTLVQGQNSIGSGNDPLYVVDGVPYPSQAPQTFNGVVTEGATSLLSYINPLDIESISVLKDADATSIYGSRAANGAILITTKKGKAGATRIDLSAQQGVEQQVRRIKLLTNPQYLAMRHEALRNDGLTVGPTDYDLNGTWDSTRHTDWQKTLVGGQAQYTTVNGGVSGGDANTQFLIDGTYHRQNTVYPGQFYDERGSMHFSINNVSPNQRFRIQLTGNYMFNKNRETTTDFQYSAVSLSPTAPAMTNPDGSFNWAPDANGNSSYYSPLLPTAQVDVVKVNNLVGNAVVSYQILKGLEVKASLGYTDLRDNETVAFPSIGTPPEIRSLVPSSALYGYTSTTSWIAEPQLSYRSTISNGKLDVLIGESIQQRNANQQAFQGSGYSSDDQLYNSSAATTLYPGAANTSIYKYNAGFGRINYKWKDRYIIDLNGRRDGSSRFGSANRFHNFAAVGAGWIFSGEPFLQRSNVVSFGKLSASYGTTGNDQIGDYSFLSTYYPLTQPTPYQGIVGIIPSGLSNPYLQWESTRKINLGIDLGFLKDRILINANYFRNRSSNQLLSYNLPSLTGFTGVTRNFPATVQNSGLELTISTTNISTKNFKWTSRLNLTIPRNKLVAFPNIASTYYNNYLTVGKSVNNARVFHFLGVNDTTGIFQFADSKGHPTSNPAYGIDNTVNLDMTQRYFGGLQNTFTYKSFALDGLFQFVKQRGATYQFGEFPGYFETNGYYFGNQPASVLNAWHKPGDHAPNQRYDANFSIGQQFNDLRGGADAWYTDAAYIRLKNVSLSWQLPPAALRKARLKNLRLYVSGQNMLTITGFKGLDPETKGNLGPIILPPLRVITGGIQLSL